MRFTPAAANTSFKRSRSRSPGIAGVDQHRFAGGRDPQRGLPALRIDDVDLQRPLRARSARRRSTRTARRCTRFIASLRDAAPAATTSHPRRHNQQPGRFPRLFDRDRLHFPRVEHVGVPRRRRTTDHRRQAPADSNRRHRDWRDPRDPAAPRHGGGHQRTPRHRSRPSGRGSGSFHCTTTASRNSAHMAQFRPRKTLTAHRASTRHGTRAADPDRRRARCRR